MKKRQLLVMCGCCLAGSIFCQSEINVTEIALSDTVATGASSTMTFTIQNTGDASLDYQIAVYTDTVLFTKAPYADYMLSENQDWISSEVILTRQEIRGLFNIAQESMYGFDGESPLGTLWMSGLTAGQDLRNYSQGTSNFSAGNEYSMYLPAENRFFDMYFHEWTSNGLGGGLSYTRIETVPWLTTSPESNALGGGTEDEITVTFDASYTGAGLYHTAIVIQSTDADEPETVIPVTLLVTGGTPGLSTESAVNFGQVTPGGPVEYNLVIYNQGDGIANITDISTQTSNFSVSDTQLEIYGYLQATVTLTFETMDEGQLLDTLTIVSDAQTILVPLSATGYYEPNLSLSTEELYFTLDIGQNGSQSLTLSNLNTSGDSVVWSIPEPGSLAYMLANINANINTLTSSVPTIFQFVYDSGEEPDYYISDGGADMYDDANYLNTNYTSYIYYSDNTIRNGEGAFGEHANYFTRNIQGYFVMVAEMNEVNSFYIEGNNGADGSGTVDTLRGTLMVNGTEYTVVTKQVNEQDWDPSINHIFIMETPDSLTHLYSEDTNNDYDEIQFGNEVNLLHYVLVASRDNGVGVDLDSATLFAIAEQYLEVVTATDGVVQPLPGWLNVSDATSGVIDENSSKDLSVSADASGLTAGEYQYTLLFSNVGQEGLQSVAIHLTVTDTTSVPHVDSYSAQTESNTDWASVYPNPATDLLTVEAKAGSRVRIVDCAGKLVESFVLTTDREHVSVNQLASGVYVIHISGADGTFHKPILIE